MGVKVDHFFEARIAHATSYSFAAASGDCATGGTRSKRHDDRAVPGSRLAHRAAFVTTHPGSRERRGRRFLPKPGLPAHATVPGVCRRGLASAPPASRGSSACGAHAPALVQACGTVSCAKRSSIRHPAPASATAPRSLADGRCGPSSFARRHPGLLAPHRR
jgi:hypothetical protein